MVCILIKLAVCLSVDAFTEVATLNKYCSSWIIVMLNVICEIFSPWENFFNWLFLWIPHFWSSDCDFESKSDWHMHILVGVKKPKRDFRSKCFPFLFSFITDSSSVSLSYPHSFFIHSIEYPTSYLFYPSKGFNVTNKLVFLLWLG